MRTMDHLAPPLWLRPSNSHSLGNRSLRYAPGFFLPTKCTYIYLHWSMVVKCNPSASGVCHDAVSGWKGLSPPSFPQPGHHVAQSGTGCCWIQCHPVPQPCMMTPLRFPFHLSTPQTWPMALGAHCRGYVQGGPLIVHRVTAEQNHGPCDCWAERLTHRAGSLSMQPPPPQKKKLQLIDNKMSLWDLKIDFFH